jgi:hypothetical protein
MNFSSAKGGEAFGKEKWLFQQAICLFFPVKCTGYHGEMFLNYFVPMFHVG